MDLKAAIAVLAVALLAAGCLAQPVDDRATYSPSPPVSRGPPPTEPTPSQKPVPTATPPPTTSPPENRPPVVKFTASPPSGPAPLNVSFTLEASDPESQPVWYWFDANGDGVYDKQGNSVDLPQSFVYRYPTEGLFAARLWGSDGPNEVVAERLMDIGPPVRVPIQHVTGSYPAGLPDTCQGSSNIPTGFVGFDVDRRTVNRTFYANYTFDTPPVSLRVTFYDDQKNGIAPSYVNNASGATLVVGRVPPRAWTGSIGSCGGAGVSVDYRVY